MPLACEYQQYAERVSELKTVLNDVTVLITGNVQASYECVLSKRVRAHKIANAPVQTSLVDLYFGLLKHPTCRDALL